jgi:hypothetical protein
MENEDFAVIAFQKIDLRILGTISIGLSYDWDQKREFWNSRKFTGMEFSEE